MSFYQRKVFTLKQMLDAGVQIGHLQSKWNPKMAPYIYGVWKNTHIIDLEETARRLDIAMDCVSKAAERNARILFISTKKQAKSIVEHYAKKCGQYYINHRWLGGMLTNWHTISKSIKKMVRYKRLLDDTESNMIKKERSILERKYNNLHANLGGIANMGGLPDIVFVVGGKENMIAIEEAKRLGIQIIAIADTNFDPTGITYPIPGNDDAVKSIEFYCDMISQAVIEGLQKSLSSEGIDVSAVDVENNKQ